MLVKLQLGLGVGTSMSTFKEIAEQYSEKNLTVLPAQGKAVLINNWSNLSIEELLNGKYEAQWKGCTGIGFLCGEPNQIIWLDVDLDKQADAALISEIEAKLPPIYCGKIGNPNRRPSQAFRFNGEISRKFNSIGVEILSTGNQTIIPPSRHPNFDKEYEWVGRCLSDIDVDDLPVLPEGFIDWLDERNRQVTRTNGGVDKSLKPANGRCKHNSHNTISSMAVALFHQNYPFDRLVARVVESDRKINHDADYLYFECPSRPWKSKSIEENAKDFVEEIFKNYGPGGKKPTENQQQPMKFIEYDFSRTQRGAVIENVENVVKYLSLNPTYQNKIHYDEFQMRLFFESPKGKREWNDNDDLELSHRLQLEQQMKNVSDLTVNKAVRTYANENRINSVTQYFDSLTWDGVPRIGKYFIDYMGAEDTEYTRRAARNFFISMVARAYKPGCKVDNMVILEGPQGQKKSTANSILVGDHIFSEISESIDSKDFLMSLQGKLLVEIAELDSFNKAEMTKVKQVITNRIDRFRPPYGRASVDMPRTCVFVGTTNEDVYLNDVTGGRRFWPIKITEIDLPAIDRDRAQLFAEGVECFKAGHAWWEMPPELTAQAQEDRRVVDEFELIIQDYLADKAEVTLWDVAFLALDVDKQRLDIGLQRRIGRCLRANGFRSATQRHGAGVKRVWCRTTPMTPFVRKAGGASATSSELLDAMFPRSK